MLGLIKKDLFMIKSNFKLLAILLFIYGFMAYEGEMDLSFLLPFMSVMMMISTFSYDAFNKWDAYAITLPKGRKNSVRAKYLATLFLVLVVTFIITILSIGIVYVRTKTIDLEATLGTILGTLFATTLIQAFMYPAIYKFGVEKARIGLFIGVFGIAIIGSIIARVVDFDPIFQALERLNNGWFILLPLIMIFLLFVSYILSESIYKKKEY